MKFHGKEFTIKFNKEVRLRVSHYFAAITEFRNESKIKLTYDGLPVILGDLVKHIRRKEPKVLRLVLTVLS